MATTRLIASTPSPPPNIHTPTTPKHGFADSWEPFSPRKSSRIAAAQAAAASSAAPPRTLARTPSPTGTPGRPHGRTARTLFHSAVLSPEPTPRKKKTAPVASPHVSRATGSSSKTAAAAAQAASSRASMMLPTPAKTPSKKVHAASQNESNIAAIARNLFHTDVHTDVEAVMASPSRSSPRKTGGRKKYTGFTLESFTAVEQEEPIAIFTDSQDRVPEADTSVENPFYGDGAALPAEPPRRRSKRNHVSIPGEGRQTVEEATQREDGLVYVFRGKRIFRKFADAADQEDGVHADSPEQAGRRLTRSSMKPRLLFPRNAPVPSATETVPMEGMTDDEEALTDIEEGVADEADEETEGAEEAEETEAVQSAKAAISAPPSTPPPMSGPASPPTTTRVTRAKKRSPFDGWRQTKSTAAAGHKRSGEALTAAAKRSRV